MNILLKSEVTLSRNPENACICKHSVSTKKERICGHEFYVGGFTTVTPTLFKTGNIIIAGESLIDLCALVFTSTCK